MQFNISLTENIVEEIRKRKLDTEKEVNYIRRAVMEKLEREKQKEIEEENNKKSLEEMEKEWKERNYIRGEN